MVQFALILPLFMMLVLGMLTGGASYNRQLGLTHAALEGARYGATLPAAIAMDLACSSRTSTARRRAR